VKTKEKAREKMREEKMGHGAGERAPMTLVVFNNLYMQSSIIVSSSVYGLVKCH
jgi:hypothetical protein